MDFLLGPVVCSLGLVSTGNFLVNDSLAISYSIERLCRFSLLDFNRRGGVSVNKLIKVSPFGKPIHEIGTSNLEVF